MRRGKLTETQFALIIEDEKLIANYFAKLLSRGKLKTKVAPTSTRKLDRYLESLTDQDLQQLLLVIVDQRFSSGNIGKFLKKAKISNPEVLILEKSGWPTKKKYQYSDIVIFDIIKFTTVLEKIGPNTETIALLIQKIK